MLLAVVLSEEGFDFSELPFCTACCIIVVVASGKGMTGRLLPLLLAEVFITEISDALKKEQENAGKGF